MDKDRVKGTVDEVVGSTKRQFGKLTGNTGTQVEGAAQQLKGKVENAVGKLKDAGRNAQANYKASQEREAALAADLMASLMLPSLSTRPFFTACSPVHTRPWPMLLI